MIDKGMSDVCKRIHFDLKRSEFLIFVTEGQIQSFNFIEETSSVLYDFANDFTEQPEFFNFNEAQDICIIASTVDTLMINLQTFEEIDLDTIYGTKDVKKVIYDDGWFFILANVRNGQIGNYLLRIPENFDSNDTVGEGQFLINSITKLYIGDCDMVIRTGENTKIKNQQLIVSYKSIFLNVYNIDVLNIQTGCIVFRHESVCLWESNVTSFFNLHTKDFISLSAEGMSIMSLSGTQQKKQVIDNLQCRHQAHSLPSCNYLKLEKQNTLRF